MLKCFFLCFQQAGVCFHRNRLWLQTAVKTSEITSVLVNSSWDLLELNFSNIKQIRDCKYVFAYVFMHKVKKCFTVFKNRIKENLEMKNK